MTMRRVLICRTGAMGDVLHALPAVAALRAARPEWHIGWVVDPRWAPLIGSAAEGEPLPKRQNPADRAVSSSVVSCLHRAETRLWSSAPFSQQTRRSVLQLRSNLRAQRYDLAVDLQGTLRSAILGRLSGAGERTGYGDSRESAARWFYTKPFERRGTHVVLQGMHLLGESCGLLLEPTPFALPADPAATRWAETTLRASGNRDRPICVLAPGAGWGSKRWPAERFGALAQQLTGSGYRVLVNAVSAEDSLAAAVVSASAETARPVVCSVPELVALLREAALLVGGDSGPLHLAAALGTPVVALFGPTDPERNGPLGPGPRAVLRDPLSTTSYKRGEAPDPGLVRLSVAQVIEAVRRLV